MGLLHCTFAMRCNLDDCEVIKSAFYLLCIPLNGSLY